MTELKKVIEIGVFERAARRFMALLLRLFRSIAIIRRTFPAVAAIGV
jgi:hypothetical protein